MQRSRMTQIDEATQLLLSLVVSYAQACQVGYVALFWIDTFTCCLAWAGALATKRALKDTLCFIKSSIFFL